MKILFFIFCSWTLILNAQQTLNTCGNTIPMTSKHQIDYSIGESITCLIEIPGSNYLFTSGVIQPWYNISTIIEEEFFKNHFYVNAFPNPFDQILMIDTDYHDFNRFIITNLIGHEIATGVFNYLPLNLSKYKPGSYFLTLFSSKTKYYKTLKIIKL